MKFIKEIEEQRNGRNKSTIVNHTYLASGEYRKKFDKISNNKKLNRLLYVLARKMLKHRSGTNYEDMYWIDMDTIKVIAKETETDIEKEVRYSPNTQSAITQYEHLVTIHSHPDSFPPSIEDFNSNFQKKYDMGIVACHDGKIFMYFAYEKIEKNYHRLIVEDYIKAGYNDFDAQICALSELMEKFSIRFEEVS